MSDLTNTLINNTYKKLLQVNTSGNTGVDTSLTNVQSGDGTNTAIKIATSAVQVTGTFGVSGNASVVGDLQITSKVCASAFFGDGSNLTNLPAGTVTGNISVSNAIVGGTLKVSAATSLGGTLKVLGATTITGNSGFLGTVKVSGPTSLGSTLDVAGNTSLGGTVTITGNVMVSSGLIAVKNGGSQSEVRLYCESGNAHYAALQAPAHSAFSGNITLTLPAVTDTIAGIAATQTFTNKTFGDKVEFEDDVCVSGNTQLVGTLKVTGATTITGATGFLYSYCKWSCRIFNNS